MGADRITVLERALRNIRELNMMNADENGHRWAHSDLIEQEIVSAGVASRAVPEAVTAAQVRVKPLVWERSFGSIQHAPAMGWRYMIGLDGDVWLWWREIVPHRKGKAASEEAAKAAAQSDYEARILAALDLTPAPAVEPVAMTVQDAARDVELLLSAYKGLLVLHRIMVKSGLHAGEKTTSELADRIVAAHPEFPARAALRAIGGDA